MRDNNVFNLHDDGPEMDWLSDARSLVDNAFEPARAEVSPSAETPVAEVLSNIVDIQAYKEAAQDTSIANVAEVTPSPEIIDRSSEIANTALIVANTTLALRSEAATNELNLQDTRRVVITPSSTFDNVASLEDARRAKQPKINLHGELENAA